MPLAKARVRHGRAHCESRAARTTLEIGGRKDVKKLEFC